jgi:hypothetical protein
MQRVAAVLVMAMLCACNSGTGATGESGSQGLKGDKGDRGEQGPPGDKGDKGDPGSAGGGSASSGSRIKMRVATGSDGSRQVLSSWWDSTLSTECSFMVASDGVERCVPGTLSLLRYFTDSNCTQPIALWSVCSNPPAYVIQMEPDTSCSSAPRNKYRVYLVGTQVAEPASLYYLSGTTCQSTQKPSATNYYQRGAEVPAADLVSRTVSIQ